nr:putative integron gene cassette protein [uncultured bacterium]
MLGRRLATALAPVLPELIHYWRQAESRDDEAGNEQDKELDGYRMYWPSLKQDIPHALHAPESYRSNKKRSNDYKIIWLLTWRHI